MDRENDNSPGGRTEPNASPTASVVAPLAPPRPIAAIKYWDGDPVATSGNRDATSLVRDPYAVGSFTLPLPLAPSQYAIEIQSLQPGPAPAPVLVTSPFPQPSVAATLPPLPIEVIQPLAPVLRVLPETAAPIDPSRLSLAPEAHVRPVGSVAFGRDPVIAAPVQVLDQPPVHKPVAPPVPQPPFRVEAPVAINVAEAPVRIEPVFAPRPATPDRDVLAVAPDVSAPTAPAHSAGYYVRRAATFAVYAAAGYLALIAFLILAYRFVNPPMSSLMLQQWISGQPIAQSWADIDEISPQVVRAVLLSEDGRFCEHTGVDFDAMQDAIEKAGDGAPRGASTISMQVVKNLFLWPSKSYVRKAIEIPLTWAMELVWPKRRIMEIYLNIAEWGPGIFGVEAASQFHFQKSARRLNEREAAQLAVSLPNPYMRDAGDPGPKTRRLASDIQARMRNAYASQTACVLRPGAGR